MTNLAQQTQLLLTTEKNTDTAPAYQPLWMCIHFPLLSAHSLGLTQKQKQPFIIFQRKSQTVHYACPAAQQLGIETGMPLSQAYLFCETMIAYPRNKRKEKSLIQSLALWAKQFSPHVSVKYENALLLEIRASLNLFDNIYQLEKRIRNGLQVKAYPISIASSPIPIGSYLLARKANNIITETRHSLHAELGKLDLADFLTDQNNQDKLSNLGITTGHELFRLPVADLSRRLGKEFHTYLNTLLGIQHEPVNCIKDKLSFYDFYDFSNDEQDFELILRHMYQLVDQLLHFLIRNDLSCSSLSFTFSASNKASSTLIVNTSSSTRDKQIWYNLIREKLNAKKLSQNNVYGIQLNVSHFQHHNYQNQSLLHHNKSEQSENWQHAIDQITARLGPNAICMLEAKEDHRPEFSYRKTPYNKQQHKPYLTHKHTYRPLWLLAKPIAISRQDYVPSKNINIERIEDGWWDKQAIRRDYYIAKAENNDLLWMYVDLKNNHQHFLHGYFA